MKNKAAVKKIMSVISVFFLGIGSIGCSGQIFSSMLTQDNTQLLALLLATQNAIPTVTSITSNSPNGMYKVGDAIDIRVQFNKPVTLSGGTLEVALDANGGTPPISVSAATYPATELAGTYTVALSDTSADLDSLTLTLGSGATVTDQQGVEAILTFLSGLAANKNIIVDGILPSVSFSATPPINIANQAAYTVTGSCSENGRAVAVAISDAGNAHTVNASPTCSTGSFTAGPLDVTSLNDGSVSVTVNHTDAAGNADQDSASVAKNTDAPTVSFDALSAINNSNRTSYTVSGYCSEIGQVVAISIDGGTVTANPVCSSGGGGTFTASSLNVSAVGDDPAVSIIANHQDTEGNSAVPASTTVLKDTVDPTVSFTSTPVINLANASSYVVSGNCSENGQLVVVSVNGTPYASPTCSSGSFTTTGMNVSGVPDNASVSVTASHSDVAGNTDLDPTTVVKDTAQPTVSISTSAPNPTNAAIPVTITFNENVTGFVVTDITVGNGSAGSFAGGPAVYTATITPSGQGAVTVDVNASVAQDSAGNWNTAATQLSRTYDSVQPTVSITSTAPDPTNQAIPVTITFNESVTGFVVGDITVGNGTAGSFAGGPSVYTAIITPAGLGLVTVDVNASVAQDAAGNYNTAATQLTRTYNNTRPTVSITSAAPDPTNAAIPVTITFSAPVTGFIVDDITVTNGSAGSFAGGPAVYTATITPSGQGEVTAQVAENVAQDIASNWNTASNQLSRTYDSQGPTVSISSTAPNPTNAAIPVTITFSESVTGFEVGDITVGNGSAGTFSGSGTTYYATITPTPGGNVSVTVDVNASVAQDAAGNNNSAAAQLTRTYDSVSPTVSISTTAPNPTNVAIPVTITFSESVTGFVVGDITVGNGSAGSFAGGPSVYTATITPSGQGSVTVDVNASVAQDAAGNNNSAASQLTRTYDSQSPTVSITTTAPNPTNVAIPVTITFNENVTGFVVGDITVGNGSAGSFAGGPAVYTATITPSGQGAVTVDVGAGVAQDAAGNTNSAAAQLSRTYDTAAPTITAAETMDVDHDGKIDYYKLTFSKNIKDSTFPGYVANSLGNAQTAWLVAGYTGVVLAHGTAAPESDSTNDTVLYLKFNEASSGYDTGVKPDLTTTATPGLTDTVGTTGNVIAQVNTGSVSETDKAAPIIVSARGVTGETSMSIVFSEEVDPNGSTGACSSLITTAAFNYTNASGGDVTGISSMGSDASACGDSTVTVTLNTALTAGDLTPTPDTINAVASAILDMNNNSVPASPAVAIAGAISPYVYGVTATGARKIQITYSEPVDNGTGTTGARNLSNYTLIEDPVQSGCSGGSDTVNLTGTVTEIVANQVFELSTDADQCPTTTYRLTVANVVDINDAVVIKPPLYATFLGNERLKVASATCLTTKTMDVVFNKTVLAGSGSGGAETTTRYKFTGATDLGSLSSAVRGSGGNTNRVTLTHATDQTGASYTVIGSNATNGDGFDDSGLGAIQDGLGLGESLQLSPRDRAPWSGCGTAIDQFAQGPISVDPFGDGSDFGYLASYNSRVYIGPNINGNAATRMEADGTNPSTVYFEFTKDTNAGGGGTHSNTATTRDGGVAVPPYVTIGHTGCTVNNADLNTGCGPDNEDGRGVFSVGTIGSTSYIFLGGVRSAENFDYVYYSSDTDVTLNYRYIDMGTITGSVTQGLSSIAVFGDRVYVGMAKVNYGGTGRNAPDFGRINFTASSGEGTACTAGSDCDATDASGGKRMFINCIASFGGTDQYVNQSNDNYAYYVGVDALYVYKNQIYAANGGYNQVNHNGGVIRSTSTFPAAFLGDTGQDCSGGGWALITPSATAWHNSPTNDRFSLELIKVSDLIPRDKAVAGFAEHENNLYMARTACSVANGSRTSERDSVGYVTGCTADDYSSIKDYTSNRRPQLWKCVPGGDNVCDSGDWSLIDSNSDGITNMGDSDNHSMTMIVKNGTYLYVGFDNLNDGVRIYRTNATNPTESDFTLVGSAGLGDAEHIKEIYSAISIQSGTNYYIYVSAGMNATPVSVYRQVNQ
jgi:hypothetical protein